MIPKDLSQYTKLFTEYTELRVQENRSVSIALVNGDVMGNDRSATSGVSARTYRNGLWGFASNPIISNGTISEVISSATRNARFLDGRLNRQSEVLPCIPGTISRDFSAEGAGKTQKELISFLRELDARITEKYERITSRTIAMQQLDMEKTLLTSDGASAHSLIPRSIVYILLNTEHDGDPVELHDVYDGLGQFEDVFTTPDVMYAQLDEQYEHLMKKAEGVHPDAGMKDCILDADLAGILSHEAIGHTVEADIVKGGSIAGDYLGKQVASPLVTLVDFANTCMGETCPVPVFVDDEGTLASDAVLIEDGVLKRFLHNKETAPQYDDEPAGNARAFRFSDEPIIRMRNTAILPGDSRLEDMIGSIDDGYYLMKSSNGQADSTSEFMFGVVQGYEIKGGKIERGLRDTTISGVAFDMLKTITAISDEMKWTGAGMCGKKQPIPVGMGGPAIKCRVNIGGK